MNSETMESNSEGETLFDQVRRSVYRFNESNILVNDSCLTRNQCKFRTKISSSSFEYNSSMLFVNNYYYHSILRINKQ